LVLAQLAHADADSSSSCAQKDPKDDVGRLECYDQMAASAAQKNEVLHKENETSIPLLGVQTIGYERSYLTKVWNLDDLTNWDASQLNRIQPYRQTYLLVNTTSNPNRQPGSPTIDNNTLTPFDIDAQEAKFQFSLKADIGIQRHFDFLGIKTFRLWAAYTQQSNWQAFNLRNSSPFRETLYEPELIATLGTGNASGLKLINIGGVHQSNGRSLPESRSWNRIYVLGGWEWNDTTSIFLRRWQRIKEPVLTDDIPDISDYFGLGDLLIRWEPKDKTQSVAILLRNNLNVVDNRGHFQIDWATPVNLGHVARLHIQMTSGYGESLIDYNHRQNTIGVGVSFREW
jgi:phospholipase A1